MGAQEASPTTEPDRRRWTLLGEQVPGWYLRDLAASLPRTSVEERPEAFYFRTDLPASEYNGATVLGAPSDLAAVVQRARALCGRKVPWGLSLRDDAWTLHRGALEAQGFREQSSQPSMVLPRLPAQAPAWPPGLTIARAETPEALACFFATAAKGFGIPGGALHRFLVPKVLRALIEAPRTRWFVGLVEGRPVATSMGVVYGEATYVAWVSTLPAHRRKGYGEALTWHAILSGRPDGGRIALLRASKPGEPVYRRMGFQTLALYRSIVAPDRSALRGLRTLLWFLGVSLWYRGVRGRLERWPGGRGAPTG